MWSSWPTEAFLWAAPKRKRKKQVWGWKADVSHCRGASLLISVGLRHTLTLPEENTSEEEVEGTQHKKPTWKKKHRNNLTLIRCYWKWRHEEFWQLHCIDQLNFMSGFFVCGVLFMYNHSMHCSSRMYCMWQDIDALVLHTTFTCSRSVPKLSPNQFLAWEKKNVKTFTTVPKQYLCVFTFNICFK